MIKKFVNSNVNNLIYLVKKNKGNIIKLSIVIKITTFVNIFNTKY